MIYREKGNERGMQQDITEHQNRDTEQIPLAFEGKFRINKNIVQFQF